MKLSEIAHFTPNVAGMAAFYRALLNRDPVAASTEMAIFMEGDVKVFIHKAYEPGEGELPPEDHHAYTVPDVDAACRALAEKGLVIALEPRDYYWGRSAYLRDPDGNLIELTEPAGEA
jgi:catechol 2,3-dioxygenase-like lactoylglutathione lyase family enzyme